MADGSALLLLVLAALAGCRGGGADTGKPAPTDTGTADTTGPTDTPTVPPHESGGTPGWGPPAVGETRALDAADATITGDAPGDLLGDNVAAPGDVDGDGHADLWIGAKDVDTHGDHAGAATLWYGPVAGARVAADADATILGLREGDYLGGGLAGAGDVDGDGLPDLLVGSKLADPAGDGSGAAWLLLGPQRGALSVLDAAALFTGEHPGDIAGGSVAGPGDLDGDGFGEVLVAARDEATVGPEAGAIYLVRGPVTDLVPLATADAKLTGEAAGDATTSATGVGDVDGDGLADFACSAGGSDVGGTDAGTAYVFTHVPVGIVPVGTADARLPGPSAGARVGAVAGIGDLDGDGIGDLLVGGPGASVAWVVRGPVSGERPLSAADATLSGLPGEQLGFAVDGPGDVDGDGVPDLLIGALLDARSGAATGAAWWVPGPVSGSSAIEEVAGRLEGVAAGDEAGQAVAGPGDVDADGYADLLIGAHYAGGNGAAYLVRGGPGI